MDYPDQNKDTLIPIYLPTASQEFMMLEEVWNIAKQDVLVLKQYSSFEDFRQKVSLYFRTKRFGLNMRNYLLRRVRKHMLIGIVVASTSAISRSVIEGKISSLYNQLKL